MLKKILTLIIIVTALSASAIAQEPAHKFDGFVGYSYLRLKGERLPEDSALSLKRESANLNGWQGSGTYYVVDNLGLTADFAGNYGRVRFTTSSALSPVRFTEDFSVRLHTFHFGPTVRHGVGRATFSAHALLGVARLSGDGESDTAFSGAFGVGVDWRLNKRFSVRVGQFSYMFSRFDSPGERTQDGFRYSGGIVGHF